MANEVTVKESTLAVEVVEIEDPPRQSFFLNVVGEISDEESLKLLEEPKTQVSSLMQIRHSHHSLAQLIAQGRRNAEISLISGYSPEWIGKLKSNPAFNELVAYYKSQRDAVFADVLEQMRDLGLSTLNELKRRLEEDPAKFSTAQLLEISKTLLGPMAEKMAEARNPSGRRSGEGVVVNVNFDGGRTVPPIIDSTATEVPG